MTSISMRELLPRIRTWAASSVEVSRLLIAGSQADRLESENPISGSDVDLIVYMQPNGDKDTVMRQLADLSISTGVLLHPLLISQEDRLMKESISEYKSMIETGQQVYPAPMKAQPEN